MKTYRCVIIEDEFPATELLKGYLSNFENWCIDGVFADPIEALTFLSKNMIDVLFLDIQLPKLNGLELLHSLNAAPLVIITSAYPEHAVKAFELTVFDYLLKPYSLSRFVQTINRVHALESETREKPFVTVRENRNSVKIYLDDIFYIESQREYIVIVHNDVITRTKIPIARFYEMLPEESFVRTHRSFIIALDKISQYNQKQLIIREKEIPIGRLYKNDTIKKIESKLS